MHRNATRTATRTVAFIQSSDYCTSQFSFHAADGSFTQEASQLGWRPGVVAQWIKLTSHRTGATRLFRKVGTLRTPGGDVGAWVYSDDTENGLTIKVWND